MEKVTIDITIIAGIKKAIEKTEGNANRHIVWKASTNHFIAVKDMSKDHINRALKLQKRIVREDINTCKYYGRYPADWICVFETELNVRVLLAESRKDVIRLEEIAKTLKAEVQSALEYYT